MNLGKVPVVGRATECNAQGIMNVRIVLHVAEEDLLLFAGPSEECPPIPRTGDEIVHERRRVRLEGICYRYGADHLEIGLLA